MTAERLSVRLYARDYATAARLAQEWIAQQADPLRYGKPRRHVRTRPGLSVFRFAWRKKHHAPKVRHAD